VAPNCRAIPKSRTFTFFRNTEIKNLYVLHRAPDEEKVARLYISMHDAACMRRTQRVGDVQHQLQRLFDGKHAALEPLREAVTLEPFHHEVRFAGDRNAMHDVTYDMGMLESGEEPAFIEKTGRMFAIRIAQDFERSC
jgi:hypothetical protein